MAALSPFPEKLNPGEDESPGLGIFFDNCTRKNVNDDSLQEKLSEGNCEH